MHLFPWTDANDFDLCIASDRLDELLHVHAGYLRHEDLASVHLLDATDHEPDSLLQRDPEAGHALVRDRKRPSFPLFEKQGDDAAAAADHVAIADATETNLLRPGIGIALNHEFLGAQFCGAVQVDRVHRFVRAQGDDPLDPSVEGGFDHIPRAHDVRHDRFHGVVLAGRDLLEGRGMDDDIDAFHRSSDTVDVPYIADEVPDAWVVKSVRPHLVLLQFISAENDQLSDRLLEDHLSELLPKRPRPSRDEHRPVLPELSRAGRTRRHRTPHAGGMI